jgi:hypothetical protein
MRIPLIGGSYTSRSIIASAQRCINYYPEVNPKSAIIPLTHYQRPGLTPLFNYGPGPMRGLHRASDTIGYGVSGNQFFKINLDSTQTGLGTIGTSTGPVSMTDNGIELLLVDGSNVGYKTTLGASDFSVVSDPTGVFNGANQVGYVDTFIVWNLPNSSFFGSTLSNQIGFDGLFFAGKVAYPDDLKAIYINRREIFLFGDVKTELWYNVGGGANTQFPFQLLPGTYVEHGISAPFSVSSHDINVFWLGRDLQGEGVVFAFRGYLTQRISNHALEDAIRKMQRTVGISDALAFTYQTDGHWFYMLTFPAGNQTWVYDVAVEDHTAAWHQEAWTNPADGSLNRHRASCMAFINGVTMVGDWQNNTVYYLNLDQYVDIVNGTNCPITCIRTFPHLGHARIAGGNQQAEVDGRRLQFSAFRADIESGMGPLQANGSPAQLTLRWSDDRGRTFGTDILQSNGAPGEYLTQPQWLGMGVARDRLFEVQHSIAGPAALNGAWVDAEVLGT